MLSVFVGSSVEGLPYAEDVCEVLQELGMGARLWNDDNLFLPAQTIVESLEAVGNTCGAAVLVASEDDRTVKRGTESLSPRDNVVYEAGYFSGLFGRRRVAIVKVGAARLPTDLDGLVHVHLALPQRDSAGDYDHSEVRRSLKAKLRGWVRHLPDQTPPVALPRLTKAMTEHLHRSRREKGWGERYDALAADLLNQLADSLGSDKGITARLVDQIARMSLPQAIGIYAIDVLGPSGWLSPTSYRYLAGQIREYIHRNVEDDKWNLRVSEPLAGAIRNGIAAVSTQGKQSGTLFDNPGVFTWCQGSPRLEFCRLLLWSRAELQSQVAESIIAIHEAFNVPLFFKETAIDDPARDVDFIYFATATGMLTGFYGNRKDNYETNSIDFGRIPSLGDPAKKFWALMESKPMFAIDARESGAQM